MKKIIFFLSVLAATVSCGPSKHIMYIDMRQPSKSGVDLADKIVSVVYFESSDQAGTTFNSGMADGFASALEQDFGTGEGSVGVYSMRKISGADYSSRDSLINLIVDTGSDAVILFDEVRLGTPAKDGAYVPFSMTMYCFDGMDKTETVKVFAGNSSSAPDGLAAGQKIAESFKMQWKTEPFSLAYYDGEKWYKALDCAEAYDWKGAIDQWFLLLDTNDLMRRSCAEYNIALACYMMGDYNLASQWLDRSDEDNKLPNMSDALRKRINARK